MNITEAREILEQHRWKHPGAYFGFNPEDSYLLYSQHRESKVLDESNWCSFIREMGEAGAELVFRDRDTEGEPDFYEWRASCSMVGWVGYLMIRDTAPDHLLIRAAEILKKLEGYPILDEDDWSERECDAVSSWWEKESLSWRVEMCQTFGANVFAARRDYPPSEVEQGLRDIV